MSFAIPAYDEIAIVLANLDPQKIIQLRPSDAAQARLRHLLDINREGQITSDEMQELDRILALDHLISLAKAHTYSQMNA